MLVYDWMWWGQLTNQNLVRRGVRRCGGVHGGVWRVRRAVWRGAWRSMERCTEVCGGVRRGVWRGVRRCTEGCVEVHGAVRRCAELCGGAQRGVWRCAEGWWGQLTNQNLAWRCVEGCTEVRRGVVGTINQSESCAEVCRGVRGGVWRGVRRCAEGWWGQLTNQNLAWRCTEGCAEGYAEVHGEVRGGVLVHVCHWLPIATIDLVGDNRNLKFEAYFEVLYPLRVVDSLRTLKVHHCLSLVTIGCP